VQAARKLFGALAREAGERVLREVARHSISCELDASDAKKNNAKARRRHSNMIAAAG
jgi:hypothetical protein